MNELRSSFINFLTREEVIFMNSLKELVSSYVNVNVEINKLTSTKYEIEREIKTILLKDNNIDCLEVNYSRLSRLVNSDIKKEIRYR
jgi:hypothetical protein